VQSPERPNTRNAPTPPTTHDVELWGRDASNPLDSSNVLHGFSISPGPARSTGTALNSAETADWVGHPLRQARLRDLQLHGGAI